MQKAGFAVTAKDSPKRPAPATLRDYGALLREPDTLSMAFLYSLTFGGFVGLASFLPTYFHEQYHISRVAAGDVTTVVVVSGSLLRPIGGWLSDRFGGYRLLVTLLTGFAVCLGFVAAGVTLRPAVALFFVGLGLLGMGNGAVFQLVPQRFPERIGLVTGIVGAAGGLGGFFLPSVLGAVRDYYGSYAPGLILFTTAFVAGTFVLLELGNRWSRNWNETAIQQAGVYSYRATLRAGVGQAP